MVVVYEAQGHATQYISTRIPFEGEALEDVIAMFSPVPYWEAQVRPLSSPVVGASGTVVPVVESVVESVNENVAIVTALV